MTLAELRKRRGQPVEPQEVEERAHEAAHPGPMEYVQIGVILAVITAVEVALFYIELMRPLLVTLLMILSALKFGFVVLWFMHLKFDHRLFASMFVLGLLLAVSVFVVALATLGGKLV
jgi:cytochrome c oxidase subunit 4